MAKIFYRQIILLFFLLFSGFIKSYTQEIFLPGYIITRGGEKLNGLVAFRTVRKTPDVCIFKRFDLAVKVKYTPGAVKSFGYDNGKRYDSFNSGGKDLFFETLVNGALSLYRRDGKYYLQKDDTEPVEVKERNAMVKGTGGDIFFSSPGELLAYMTGVNAEKFKNISDLSRDLVPAVVAYNKEHDMQFAVFPSEMSRNRQAQIISGNLEYRPVRVGITSGVNSYYLSLKRTGLRENIFLPGGLAGNDFFPGLSVSYQIRGSSGRFYLRGDPQFLFKKFYASQKSILPDESLQIDASFLKMKAVKIPVIFEYHFIRSGFRPFLNTGLGVTCIVQYDYLHQKEQITNNIIVISEDRALKGRRIAYSLMAGAGIDIPLNERLNFRVEGRVEPGTGFLQNRDMKDFLQFSVQTYMFAGIMLAL
ncbi:MAG: PorT family protein [Bacteroidales bacterium]|nr:PorT family protein [Bacteroidales bacterium]